MANKNTPHNRELAIRRLFAEGLKCSPDSLQEFKSSILGRWGDPAGIANADFFDCFDHYMHCLDLKYVVGYTILVVQNIIEQCRKDIRQLLLSALEILDDYWQNINFNNAPCKDISTLLDEVIRRAILKELENLLLQLETYRCPQDCEKILQLLDEIIDKYIFPPEFYKDNPKTILDCCKK